MLSENKNQNMKFVRFLASPGAIIGSILIIDLHSKYLLQHRPLDRGRPS